MVSKSEARSVENVYTEPHGGMWKENVEKGEDMQCSETSCTYN
jgi:hypothetical protein